MNTNNIRSSIDLDYSNLDLNTLDYDSFIKNFKIYPTYKKAKKKGFEAHHLIPLALQIKNFNIENNQNLNKEQFLKFHLENPISIRCTPFEHILIHYLLAKKFEGIYSLIFVSMCSVNSPKLLEFETLKINDLLEFAKYREQSNLIMQQKLKQAWEDPNKFNRQERNKNISKSLKGRHYYNNGIIEVKSFECPIGFIPGRLKNTLRTKKVKESMAGRKAYTNPKTKKVIYLKEGQEIPKGFILGRKGNGGGPSKNYKIFNNGIIEKHCSVCPDGFQEGSLINKVKQDYKKAKEQGSLLSWNEFQREYKKNARK